MSEMIGYTDAVQAIKTAILQGQYEASKGVNRVQLAVYFCIGKYVSLNSRKGKWGTGALKTISEQLRREMPGLRGYSANNMKLMRQFYEAWTMLDANSTITIAELDEPNTLIAINEKNECNSVVVTTEINNSNSLDASSELQTAILLDASSELQIARNEIDIYSELQFPNWMNFPVEDFFKVPFSHHIRIVMSAKDLKERLYYIHRCAEEHLSVDRLEKLIKVDDAYHHQDTLPNNFAKTLNVAALARKAVLAFKDEYFLDFINTEEIGERDAQDIDERVVENQIIHNIKKFVLAFGQDFAFIGNQYHLEAYGEDFFTDLLFFNRELNALVVIDLKMGKFKPTYLAQLTTYLRILDDKVRKPHENPTIGIVLCKSANKEFVEYVIQDYDKPMGVATYKTLADMPERLRNVLPDAEEMRKLLDVGKDKK